MLADQQTGKLGGEAAGTGPLGSRRPGPLRLTVTLPAKVGGYVRPRRLVLGIGGELTNAEAVEPEGLTFLCFVARRHPRTAGLT